MKKKLNKKYIFFTLLILSAVSYFFFPQIIINSSSDSIIEYGFVKEFYKGLDSDGEPTLKQMLEYRRGTTIYSIMKSRDHINFPFLYANEISSILIGGTIYNLNDSLNKDKSEIKKQIRRGNIEIQHGSEMPLEIKTQDLYFFRIYVNFSDTANFENVYIKKYPWSKKRLYQ